MGKSKSRGRGMARASVDPQEKALKSVRLFREPWLTTLKWTEDRPADFSGGRIHYTALTAEDDPATVLEFKPAPWELEKWRKKDQEVFLFRSEAGPVWVLRPKGADEPQMGFARERRLGLTPFARGRDLLGSLGPALRESGSPRVHLEFHGVTEDEICGALVGLEMARYRYKDALNSEYKDWPRFSISQHPSRRDPDVLNRAAALAVSTNLARHLVNLPPEILNPQTYAASLKEFFRGAGKAVHVEIWDANRLVKEGMGLHYGVGKASEHPPCLTILRYRPVGAKGVKPLALVGKGITFDSGGLDIKPSSGMRWMKKDMGGSAALVGVFHWAVQTKLKQPLDVYLPLAENAVGGSSFAPGDVLRARNGTMVEIHNTDAEGRLILADALDVAVTAKGADEPQLVIDVATLTGAIKVALGGDVGGLFANRSELAEDLEECGREGGDLVWHMPLVQKYRSAMKSQFADMNNAVDGFGGAITAALFLQSFVKDRPWAHLDVYAWKDAPEGPFAEVGASGQGVQLLCRFLERRAPLA